MMKRLIAWSATMVALLAGTPVALAQSSPPPPPALTPDQSATLQQRLDLYRHETEGRVSRGEITADEANRLLAWRQWQLARQIAGASPAPASGGPSDVPPDYREAPPRASGAPSDVPPDYREAPPRASGAPSDVPPDYREAPPPASGAPSDVPPDYREAPPRAYAPPRDVVAAEPPPYYGPYYRYPAPYYWGPRPYPYSYWGPVVCAGGFGRHFGGRVCF